MALKDSMDPLEISATAIAEIRMRFQESGYSSPVGSIGQATPPSSASTKLREALQQGVGGEELLAIGRHEFEKVAGGLQFQLTVFVYEASDCRPGDVIDVSGVKFAMNTAMRQALRGLTLDFGPEGFFFRGPDGSKVSLSDK